ncbi:MAG: DNA polymerase III subunit beta [Thermoanaerobacteraceae bacterium]|nr:DNA polymerase III subunit beta [Thermoanaerobacteraceae bacterium]
MRISCPQPQLLNAVLKVHRAIGSTSTLSALTGILLTAGDGKVTLHATDLEMGIIVSFGCEVGEEGRLLLPARIFTDLVRHLPPVTVSLEGKAGGVVTIEYHQARAQLHSMDPDQFPSLPEPSQSYSLKFPSRDFREIVRKVGIAAGSEELRSIYHGLLWEMDFLAGKSVMVATDTHRLALYETPISPVEGEGQTAAIIPHKSLVELSRLFSGEEDEEITFIIGPSQIFATTENLTFYSRLLGGQFPPYRQVLPKDFQTVVVVPTHEITTAVERATLLGREDSRLRSSIIRLEIGDTLRLLSHTPEVGQLEEELPAEITGPGLEVALNGRYLLDALKVIEEEKVILKFIEPLKPLVVQPQGVDHYFCLILPVRLG